jgi:hypothetical protein
MMSPSKLLKAPIPGENLTVNSKNYSWHRPPQFPEFDDAFEFIIDDSLASQEKLGAAMLLLSNGLSALAVVQALMISKVGQGKISPDMSLLLVGPVYKTFVRMMDAAGVEYLSGFDSPEEVRSYAEKLQSREFLSKTKKKPVTLTQEQEAEMERIAEEALEKIPEGGLMGAPVSPKSEEDVN